ncbi:DJ-1/PfpI family protein [Streptomyces sp. NPDC005931]|uniref:DJ-1/PfpI family protein n=1 Tax=Streptomyces sp. NPDC005931 TaxID=3364737 RepID=UPI00367F07F9
MRRRTLLSTTGALGAAALSATTAGRAAAAPSARPAGVSAPPGADGPLRVPVILFDGVEELDFAAPYEALSAAGHFTEREVRVRYVTVDGPRSVTAAYGSRVRVDHRWSLDDADLLVVPGAATRAVRNQVCGPRSGAASFPGRRPKRPARD